MSDLIKHHVLKDAGTEITVLSMGAAVKEWRVDGQNCVLGFADPESYRHNAHFLGAVVGRVANRTSQSSFELDGTRWPLAPNDGPHHLHGGPGGLSQINWDLDAVSDRDVILRHTSPHLDQGYPGEARIEVRMTLKEGALTWDMRVEVDRITPINLAQHLYFNLTGGAHIRDHSLQISAQSITPTGADLIPTGDISPVDGTRFDFRTPQILSEIDPNRAGYDLNFALEKTSGPNVVLRAPNGKELRLWTDRPGLQFYSGTGLSAQAPPSGVAQTPFAGLCLEAQDFPDALHQPNFGSILCRPDAPYHQRTTIDIRQT